MKRILLVCACSLALISGTAEAVRFGTPPVIDVKVYRLEKILSSHNEPLEKALRIHNLMNQLPDLQVLADQSDKLEEGAKLVKGFLDNMTKCNEKRLSSRFKNAADVLKQAKIAYKNKTKGLKSALAYPEDSVVPRSIAETSALQGQKKDIEQEVFKDVYANAKKYGGQVVNRTSSEVPESIKNAQFASLEDLVRTEEGMDNMNMALADYSGTFEKMQADFVRQMAEVGVDMPNFNAKKAGQIAKARKALQELKKQYIEEAKEYIAKLDEQDRTHPEAVAKRAARSKNKRDVLANVGAQFPDMLAKLESIDQQTPQQRQQVLIAALEKDKNGKVYLTETNALEVDQKMAEAKANDELVKRFQSQADAMYKDFPQDQNFDLSMCSA